MARWEKLSFLKNKIIDYIHIDEKLKTLPI